MSRQRRRIKTQLPRANSAGYDTKAFEPNWLVKNENKVGACRGCERAASQLLNFKINVAPRKPSGQCVRREPHRGLVSPESQLHRLSAPTFSGETQTGRRGAAAFRRKPLVCFSGDSGDDSSHGGSLMRGGGVEGVFSLQRQTCPPPSVRRKMFGWFALMREALGRVGITEAAAVT